MQLRVQTTTRSAACGPPGHEAPSSSADDGLEAVHALGMRRSIERGRQIYGDGDAADHWFRLLSGTACAVKLRADGRRQITAFLQPGDYFGFEAAIEYGFAAEALTDLELIRYPRARTEVLARTDAGIAHRFREIAHRSLDAAQRRLLMLGLMSAPERVASFLLEQFERSADGQVIHLAMSRADIGDYLGLTLETVSRAISVLKRAGLISVPNRRAICILDRDGLEELAEGEAL
ncbi:MAG TPA: helix-turn-helix domain-containing protein [Aliidongia sp.]|nr:helix-turn-helix domain-containing protein [Aliidongia sp.]